MGKLINLTNQNFDYLAVIERVDNGPSGQPRWLCKCRCGAETIVLGYHLRNRKISSCGCLRQEKATKHGRYKNPIYRVWVDMKARCYNTSSNNYYLYGGRGITVDKKWKGRFEQFYTDMSAGYKQGLHLDRIDNDKGYSKDNCRWVSPKQNGRNRRNNKLFTLYGRTQCLSAWAEEYGIHPITLSTRLRRSNISFEEALTKPVKSKGTY